MDQPTKRIERYYVRIKNNPIIASLIILGTIVIALSTFSDAMINLWDLVYTETRPAVNGTWKAEVTYDWKNARYSETFTFGGDGKEVFGTASYLGMKRGIVEGNVKLNKLQFNTITQETLGDRNKEVEHRYLGTIFSDEIRFIMQTEGGFSTHIPVEFIARKVPSP